jgi:hypothetical protein
MDRQDLDTLNLIDPNIAWGILTPSPHVTDYPVDGLHALHLVYVAPCYESPKPSARRQLFGLPLKRSGIPSHLGNVSPPSQSWIN